MMPASLGYIAVKDYMEKVVAGITNMICDHFRNGGVVHVYFDTRSVLFFSRLVLPPRALLETCSGACT